MPRAAWTLCLLLSGCVGDILDAPFVLASGLGDVRGLSPSPRRTLLVASEHGVGELHGDGRHALLVSGTPARAVAAHRDRLYVLVEDGIQHGPMPGTTSGASLTKWPRNGIHDIAASCEGSVLLADAAGVARWNPATGVVERLGHDIPGVRQLALDPLSPCEGVLALTKDAVLQVSSSGVVAVASGLDAPHALAADPWGGLWVVAGEPPVLGRLGDSGLEVRARHLDATSDLLFGFGELFHPANAYLAGPGGTLDYARVVPETERLRAPRPLGGAETLSVPPAQP